MRRAAAAILLPLAVAGCAGGRVYPAGIKHSYLCAVRSARASGYQLRAQDFKQGGGTLVAARSTPDPRATQIARGWFARLGEVFKNLWDRGALELWDEDVAAVRIRTEERVVAKFKADNGFLGFGKKSATRVVLKMDVTDYGREDWVITRRRQPSAAVEEFYRIVGDCLGVVSPAAPQTSTPAEAPAAPPPAGQAAATPPDATDALRRGREGYEAGKYAEAVAVLAPVAAADSQNAEALGYLGACYYRLKQREEAVAAYTRYVELVPSDARTREFLEELRKQ